MEFLEFVTLVKEKVEKKTGEKVRLDDIRKNNSVLLKGLTVMQEGRSIFPTIYLNDYYDAFEEGTISFKDVVDAVADIYSRNKTDQSMNMRYFLNFNCIKDRIIYTLVNTEKNRELLEDVPHMEFLDLSIIFRYLIAGKTGSRASVCIHNAHMKMWGVSAEKLFQTAEANTPWLLNFEIKSIKEVICEIMSEEGLDVSNCGNCMDELRGSIPMYVLSNKNRVEGASCILYPDLVKNFADKLGNDLYIIPSSIHEMLLLPVKEFEEAGEIKSMIKEINETQVRDEEVLSDSLYYYSRKDNQIIML